MPKEDFRREVEKELTRKETEPSEIIYFKVYKSQIPVIEQAIETAALMSGSDKSRSLGRQALASLEGVENPHIEFPEIPFIPGHNYQTMDARRRRNHGVLKQLIRFRVHDAAPFPKTRRVHREYLIRSSDLIHPTLDLVGFRWILMLCPLNSRLQFAHRHR